MKKYIECILEFIKKYGWYGFLAHIFNINSNYHPSYQDAYNDGMGELYNENGPLNLDRMILALYESFPDIEPFRTRAICTIRGLSDARKARKQKQKIPISRKKIGFCEICECTAYADEWVYVRQGDNTLIACPECSAKNRGNQQIND